MALPLILPTMACSLVAEAHGATPVPLERASERLSVRKAPSPRPLLDYWLRPRTGASRHED